MNNLPTWVFESGTYRTASTTHYQMIEAVVQRTNNGVGIGYHTEKRLKELDRPGHRYIACKVFEPIFVGFRGETSHGEILHRQGRIKAFLTVRDPRDIIVSMKRRNEGRASDGTADGWDFERTATKEFPIWLGWALRWANLGPDVTLVSRFEDFTTNLRREVGRIASHLDIELSPGEAGGIAAEFTIQAIQKRKRKRLEPGEREHHALPSIPGIVSGSSGLWQTWLTGPERKLVEEYNREYMERFGYE